MTVITLPSVSTVHVVEHHYRQAKNTWMSIVLSGFLNPVFTMLALGLGVGSLVDDLSVLGTEDYLHFVGPGVLVGAAMLQGGFASLWPAMGALKWDGMYKNAVRTPASYIDVLTGRLAWGFLRFSFSSAAFLVVLLAVIGWSGWLALFAPMVAGLTGLATSAGVLAYTSAQTDDKTFPLISRLIITPLFVFSGTFTPVESMPAIIAGIVKAFPAYHGIELARDLINQRSTLGSAALHLAVLLAWTFAGWALARNGFRKALTS